ncbi:MAG TPA: biotin/lipoyl-containing protein, partial [Streptosporangiaceae bacterium]
MTEVKQFRLPDVGEGLTEADIVTWHVKPGDQVSVNQVIVEIETAKSLVELPSPYDGVVSGLLVDEGQTVDVGTPIIEVDVAAEAGPDAGPAAKADTAPKAGPGGRKAGASARRAKRAAPATRAEAAPAAAPAASAPATPEAPAVTVGDEPPTSSQAPEDLVPPPPAEGAAEPGIHGSPAPKAERQAVLVGYGVKLGTTTRRPRKGVGEGKRSEGVSATPGGNGAGAGATAGSGAAGAAAGDGT